MRMIIGASMGCTREQLCVAVLVLLVGLVLAGPTFAQGKPEILIASGDAASLEAVVGNPAHAGYRVILEPGTYRLTNRLVLQPGMDLVGSQLWASVDENGVPVDVAPGTETVIDGSDVLVGMVGAVVEVGRDNDVEWLTLTDSTYIWGEGVIGTASPDRYKNGWRFTISDCVVEGSHFSVLAVIQQGANSGTKSHITLERNILGPSLQGWEVEAAFIGAKNAQLDLLLKLNRILGGEEGLHVDATDNGNCMTNVTSIQNIYEDSSSCGIQLFGGQSLCFIGWEADKNTLEFTSVNDIIRDHAKEGISIRGGNSQFEIPCALFSSDENTVSARFLGTKFSNNGPADYPVNMSVFGQNPPDGFAVGNKVSLLIRNVTADGAFEAAGDAVNTVEFIGSPEDFRKANNLPADVPIPDDVYFSPPAK